MLNFNNNILLNSRRGADFLGCKYPILGGAMTWVSEAQLVASISNGGGFGVLASGSMNAELLKNEIEKTKALTTQNFGVNIILINPELDSLIDVCIAKRVFGVIFAAGLPGKAIIDKLKNAHIKVIAFAPSLIFAKKLIALGIDALILEGSEAGGHIGPVSTLILAQEILPHISEVPIFIAGGIGTRAMVNMFLNLGASGCQLGTRFVMSTESIAHSNFKNLLLQSKARDAVVSGSIDTRFTVVPVRSIKNLAHENFINWQRQVIDKYSNKEYTLKEAQLAIEHFWAGALRDAVINGNIITGSVMAGQSVGLISNILSVSHILEELC